jgi:hypothetical protein
MWNLCKTGNVSTMVNCNLQVVLYLNTLVNHTIAALVNVVFLNPSEPRPILGHWLSLAKSQETQIMIYVQYKTRFDVTYMPFLWFNEMKINMYEFTQFLHQPAFLTLNPLTALIYRNSLHYLVNLNFSVFFEVLFRLRKCFPPYDNYGGKTIILYGRSGNFSLKVWQPWQSRVCFIFCNTTQRQTLFMVTKS